MVSFIGVSLVNFNGSADLSSRDLILCRCACFVLSSHEHANWSLSDDAKIILFRLLLAIGKPVSVGVLLEALGEVVLGVVIIGLERNVLPSSRIASCEEALESNKTKRLSHFDDISVPIRATYSVDSLGRECSNG